MGGRARALPRSAVNGLGAGHFCAPQRDRFNPAAASMTLSRALLCVAVGETIVWAGLYYLFPALLLRWEEAEAWPKTLLTAAFAAAVMVSAVVSPLTGRLIDRGHGPLMMTGCALFGAATLALLPFAGSVEIFAALWLLIGIAMGGTLYEPCFALVTRTRGIDARRGITLITLVAGFAGTLSFPLNHFVAESGDWHAATWTFAVLVAAVGAPLLWLGTSHLEKEWRSRQPAAAPSGSARTTVPPPAIWKSPVFWSLAAGFSLLGANHGIVINHLLPILADRGIGAGTAVFAASMIGPMQVAGRLALMASEKHVSGRAVATGCFAAILLATVSLLLAEVEPIFVALFVVLQGSGHGIISIMKPVMIREVLGETNFGAISGSIAVPYLAAFALSPFAGSLLWELGGYDLALTVGGISSLIGLMCFRIASRPRPGVADA
ncbi:MFS transporter [Aurantimonas aggregata]|uniref:MFS transporter n=1 Tax=Aurantimonas aggregata TaxID=2047720 RepID=UPI001944C22C|nr:MFS transporter [Aurantimonas aggregata]